MTRNKLTPAKIQKVENDSLNLCSKKTYYLKIPNRGANGP